MNMINNLSYYNIQKDYLYKFLIITMVFKNINTLFDVDNIEIK